MQLADVVAERGARMIVDAQGIGVTVRIESQLQVEPEGAGTKLLWNSKVTQLKGLIASVSPGLIRAAADQVIRSTCGKVRERLGEG
jgi:carbon monoxide dehydrogenase subunit G